MKFKLIGVATAVVMAVNAQAAHAATYLIEREGSLVSIKRVNNGKDAPQPTQTYIKDSNGNLRDPVTGRPKGQNY